MTTLIFENADLPEESRTYQAEIPEGQNLDAAIASMTGWTLKSRSDETEQAGTDAAANPGAATKSAPQPAPGTTEGN